MSDSKYDNLITTELIRDIPHYTGYSFVAHKGELGDKVSFGYHCITEPFCFEKPHSHDFTEMLFFFGGDPTDVRELGAEVEITFGEGDDAEKRLLTKAGCVTFPAGLTHCPIDVRNVTRPIVFVEVSLTPEYGQVEDKKEE